MYCETQSVYHTAFPFLMGWDERGNFIYKNLMGREYLCLENVTSTCAPLQSSVLLFLGRVCACKAFRVDVSLMKDRVWNVTPGMRETNSTL